MNKPTYDAFMEILAACDFSEHPKDPLGHRISVPIAKEKAVGSFIYRITLIRGIAYKALAAGLKERDNVNGC